MTLGSSHPPTQMALVSLSLGLTRPGREADHSQLVANLRMRKFIPSLPPYCLQAWRLITQKEINLHVEIYMLTKRLNVEVYTRCKTQMCHKNLQIPFQTEFDVQVTAHRDKFL